MEYTAYNPFVPKATIVRFPNSIFEIRIGVPGAVSNIDIVPHDNYILVTGSLLPRVRKDSEERLSTLVFTDQPCGFFGRDIPINLAPGTELVVLHSHQELDDYVVRFTIRNSRINRASCACADIANNAVLEKTHHTHAPNVTVNQFSTLGGAHAHGAHGAHSVVHYPYHSYHPYHTYHPYGGVYNQGGHYGGHH